MIHTIWMGFLGGSDSKESACNAGDLWSIPGLGRFPGGGHGNPLQYSCLENPTDRGACWATVHGVAESDMKTKHSTTHNMDKSWKQAERNLIQKHIIWPHSYLVLEQSDFICGGKINNSCCFCGEKRGKQRLIW